MEPNHTALSPPPPTPTVEGEEVCEIDVPDVAVDGATLLICLCGLVGNGAVLWLLGCRIRRNPITVYVLNLAVADFTFLLLMLTSSLLYILDSLSCNTFPFFAYLKSFLLPLLLTHNMGMYLLTAISIERCVSVICSSSPCGHRPQHLSAVVCALLWALSIAVIAAVAVLCLSHQHDQCRLALISMYALNFTVFAPSMVISSILLFIKVQCSSQQRQPRRLYIVIFLTVLFFLLFTLPLSIWNFVQHISYSIGHSQVVFLLACINSSINGRLPVSPQGPLGVPAAMWRGRCCRLLLGSAPRPAPGVLKGTGRGRGYAPPAERKRFYQNVSISQGEGGFEINLDHRKLKTPQAKLFTVPSEALAIAVATEWDSQKDTIKFYTMHLTTLCNTALDNPTQRSKAQLIRAAVKFLETDTVCYRVEEPSALAELQKNEWDPIIAWAEKRYNVAIGSSTSIMGPNIPASTRDTFSSHLASYNMWALQGIEYVITQLKSLILSMGLIDRHITVEKAVLLSRLEEEYQIQRWGKVEWAHDYDLCELRARAAAGTLFVHLCSESSTVKHKLLQD